MGARMPQSGASLEYSPDSRPLVATPFVFPTENGSAAHSRAESIHCRPLQKDEVAPTRRKREMAKFMFLHRGGDECATERSPEQMQQAMQAWGEWMTDGTKAGWLLDPGDGLKPEGKVVHPDRTVTDGPGRALDVQRGLQHLPGPRTVARQHL